MGICYSSAELASLKHQLAAGYCRLFLHHARTRWYARHDATSHICSSPEIATVTTPPTRRKLRHRLEERRSRPTLDHVRTPFMSVSVARMPHSTRSINMELVGAMAFTLSTEMVYDQYARVLFPGRQLCRFVEVPVPKEGLQEHLDFEYSDALTGCRRETREQAWEDYWKRWTAF
ncbi:hypothetical protein Efla_004546 [Eimeria flavescens]